MARCVSYLPSGMFLPCRWERSLVRQMVPPEDTGARQNSREERRNRHAKNRKQLGKYYAN